MIKEKLVQIGLTEYEAIIYNFLLENGVSTAQKIYKGTGINRVTTYNVLDNLALKGLVSSLDTQKKKLFIPESPNHLVDFLENKKKSLEEAKVEFDKNKEKLQQFFPELKAAFESLGDKPKVRFLEGVEGVRIIREETFESIKANPGPIFEMNCEDLSHELDRRFGIDLEHMKKHVQQLQKANIPVNLIHAYEKEHFAQEFFLPNQDVNYVPSGYPIKATITIFADKLGIISSLGNMASIIIENKDVAQTFTTLFRLAIEGIKLKKAGK